MKRKNELLSLLLSGYTHSPVYFSIYILSMLVFGFTVPIFIEMQKAIIDTAVSGFANEILWKLLFLIGYLVFYYIDTVSSQISYILGMKINHQVEKEVMHKYLDDVSNMVFAAYENGEVQNKLMRISAKQKQIYAQAVTFFPNIIRRLVELGGIFYFVAQSGVWWAFPLGIVISLPSFYFNKKRMLLARKVWNKDSHDIRYADYLNETILNRETAKERRFFGFHQYLSGLWKERFQAYNKNKISIFIKSSGATGVAMCFSMSIILVLGIALLNPLKTGVISIGLYTALLVAVSSKMNMAIAAIIREYSNLINMKHFLEDYKALEKIKKIHTKPVSINNQSTFESIVFEDVWFAYPNTDKYILKGVSFEIKKNERHALIGINGAGKTTLTKLMLGLYSPNKGKVFLNGRDMNSYTYSQVQTIFAAVQQTFARYKNSFYENICLYDLASQKPDYDKLDRALVKSETYDIFDRCKNDYNIPLTPEFTGGIMLSGGEWQKISIARAFYSERDFIIFDEPTAALDPLAEIKFYETYSRIMADHTCLFITHRLGSTFLFENCFVLADGKIKEKGSHDELIKYNGVYKKLYEKQKIWYQQKKEG